MRERDTHRDRGRGGEKEEGRERATHARTHMYHHDQNTLIIQDKVVNRKHSFQLNRKHLCNLLMAPACLRAHARRQEPCASFSCIARESATSSRTRSGGGAAAGAIELSQLPALADRWRLPLRASAGLVSRLLHCRSSCRSAPAPLASFGLVVARKAKIFFSSCGRAKWESHRPSSSAIGASLDACARFACATAGQNMAPKVAAVSARSAGGQKAIKKSCAGNRGSRLGAPRRCTAARCARRPPRPQGRHRGQQWHSARPP